MLYESKAPPEFYPQLLVKRQMSYYSKVFICFVRILQKKNI